MSEAPTLTTFLWFDHGLAREAAEFYAATFPDSHVDAANSPGADETTVAFTILGRPFVGLNGGPQYHFTEAISFQIGTRDQAETDRYWNALVENGGEAGRCGWCKDRFGLSWQVVPSGLHDALGDDDEEAAGRALEAMLGMTKIDIAEIERARRDSGRPA